MTARALKCHSQPLRPRAAQLAFFSKKTRPFDARRCQSRLLSTKVRASRAATAAQRRAATRDRLARAAQAHRASHAPRRAPKLACHGALVRAGLEGGGARTSASWEGCKGGQHGHTAAVSPRLWGVVPRRCRRRRGDPELLRTTWERVHGTEAAPRARCPSRRGHLRRSDEEGHQLEPRVRAGARLHRLRVARSVRFGRRCQLRVQTWSTAAARTTAPTSAL